MTKKEEIRKIKIQHPELGELEKTVRFTYDSDRYASLDEAIADDELCKHESDLYYSQLKDENDEGRKKIEEENEQALIEWMKLKPIAKVFEPKIGDNSQFAGRGILGKENVSSEPFKQSLSDEEIIAAFERLKQLGKIN